MLEINVSVFDFFSTVTPQGKMGSENLRFAQALGKDVFRIFHNIVALEIKLSLLPLDRKNQQLPK